MIHQQKKPFFLFIYSCIVVCLLTDSTEVKAQWTWGNTPTPTSTTGDVGIGINNVTDSRLHIDNNVYDDPMAVLAIPEIKITRNTWALTFASAPPNIFEIWRTDYTNIHLPSPFHGPNLLHVITNAGHVGILYPTPLHSLDVGGDIGINDGDLYMVRPNTNDIWRNIYAQSNSGGLALFANSHTYDGPAILMTGTTASSYAGDMRFFNGSSRESRFVFGKPGGSSNGSMTEQVVIDGNGDISMPRDNDADWRFIKAQADHGALSINSNTGSTDGATIELFGASGSRHGEMAFTSNNAQDATGKAFNFMTYNPTDTWVSRMRIYKNGKVAIGNENNINVNPINGYDYRLYVEKGILTERLKVALASDAYNWSDFVFADDYKLKSIDEVETYINKHKHLPDIPSAREVFSDGIDVAAMDAKLLQKIEELTLYTIQQQKQIASMQQQVIKMQAALCKQKKSK